MRVSHLDLTHFRNLRSCRFEPGPRLNFFLGPNAQGKTSLLEAIGLLAGLRSFRRAEPADLIQWGETGAEVQGQILHVDDELGNWTSELAVRLVRHPTDSSRVTKLALVNGKKQSSSIQYLEQKFKAGKGFHSIAFNPSDHQLVHGEPRLRRDYLDSVLASEEREYLGALTSYRRILQQRNALLRSVRLGEKRPGQVLDLIRAFTSQMSVQAARLTRRRLEWLSALQDVLDQTLKKIAPQQRSLNVTYCSNWLKIESPPPLSEAPEGHFPLEQFSGQDALPSLETLEWVFLNKAEEIGQREWHAGSSLFGPHRDDWILQLGHESLRGFGSQGEVRSALLALKLSEIELFRRHAGFSPVMLLDDFSSELDQSRREFLLGELEARDLQVFVTSTEERSVPSGKRFSVREGTLSQWK